MNTWKVIFATIVIFITGVITGGLLVRNFNPVRALLDSKPTDNGRAAIQSTNTTREMKLPAPMIGPLRRDFLDRLQRELKINAAQRERMEKAICEGQEQTRAIWLEIEPEIYQTLVDTKDRIRAELTPEQNARFEELFRPKAHPPAMKAPVPTATNSVPAKP